MVSEKATLAKPFTKADQVDDHKPAAKSARVAVVTKAWAGETKKPKKPKKTKAHKLGQEMIKNGEVKPLSSFFAHRK
jgi:hypothetical protein